jgi:hypothetical protein
VLGGETPCAFVFAWRLEGIQVLGHDAIGYIAALGTPPVGGLPSGNGATGASTKNNQSRKSARSRPGRRNEHHPADTECHIPPLPLPSVT